MFSSSGSGSGSSCSSSSSVDSGSGSAHSGSDCSCSIYQEWSFVGNQQDQKQYHLNTNTDISRRVCGAFRTFPLMYTEVPGSRRQYIGDNEYYPRWSLYVHDADGSSPGVTGVVCDEFQNVRCVGLFGYFDYVSYACQCIPPRSASSQIFHHPYLEQYGYIGMIVNHSWKLIYHEQHTCKQHHTKQVTGFTCQILWTQDKKQQQQQKEEKQEPKQQQQEQTQPFSGSLKQRSSLHSPQNTANNDGCTITYHFEVTGKDTAILSVCGVDWSLLIKRTFGFKSQRLVRTPPPVPVPTFDPV